MYKSQATLRARLQNLSGDWLGFTRGFFADRQGGHYLPREAAQLIASASPVPVFGPYQTFMDTGVLGGRMINFSQMGRTAARLSADPVSYTHLDVYKRQGIPLAHQFQC